MAQPTAMRPLRDLITLDDALALIRSNVKPVAGSEHVEIASANGRILAEDVKAPEDAPSTDRSRMDGFAVSSREFADVKPGATKLLTIAARTLAGGAQAPPLQPGTCVEVATGASLPSGADAVIPVEDSRPIAGGQMVEFSGPAKAWSHVSRRGADYTAGEVLVRAGALLTPSRVAAAASANRPQLSVRARPRVLIVPTGDEVVPLGRPLAEGQVRESNSPALSAFIATRGCSPDRHPIVRDTLDDVIKALEFSRQYDAAVFTGGTSAGAKDYLEAAVRHAGDVLFHGVKIRPGKPVLFGLAAGKPVLGLPGNPTSCMVDAHLFLDPLLGALLGAPPLPAASTNARLAADAAAYTKASPVDFLTLVLVRLENAGAHPVLKDSMTVMGAGHADGFFAVPAGKPTPAPGDEVNVVLLR